MYMYMYMYTDTDTGLGSLTGMPLINNYGEPHVHVHVYMYSTCMFTLESLAHPVEIFQLHCTKLHAVYTAQCNYSNKVHSVTIATNMKVCLISLPFSKE